MEARLSRLSPPRLHELDRIQPDGRDAAQHRAKYIMLVQSTVSLALFGLIVARAVNAFT